MSNAAKLKKRAVELEQKKQLDKALSLYVQFLQESDGTLDDVDIPLYNRVGDLMLRVGNTSEALNYYEKAVDLYADRGFLNNAIALCNKVLRQSPGRATIYYKLGRISATKGFKSDAKKNFLEYADRMQKAGKIDEAFRALKEFADLCPDQDDIRLMLAEQLSKENRQEEALEQLQKLHDKLDSEGRTAEARATVDRMKAIDPNAVPRTSGSYAPQKSSDLIFLDTSFEDDRRRRKPATPATRQVSDPDLVVLTLAEQGDAPLAPVHNATVSDALALELDTSALEAPAADGGAPDALPLLDVDDIDVGVDRGAEAGSSAGDIGDGIALDLRPADAEAFTEGGAAADLGNDSPGASFQLPSDGALGVLEHLASPEVPEPAAGIDAYDLATEAGGSATEVTDDQPRYVSGPPLGVDYASDLVADAALVPDEAGGDLFDFRSPPRSDDVTLDGPALGTLDPDVAFPSFGPDDTSLPSADEITSGGSLAAALGSDVLEDALGLGSIDIALPEERAGAPVEPPAIELDVAGALEEPTRDAPAAADVDRLDLDWPAGAADAATRGSPGPDAPLLDLDDLAPAEPATSSHVALGGADATADAIEAGEPAAASGDAPLSLGTPARGVEPVAPLRAVAHVPQEPASASPSSGLAAPSWESRRAHAERLLEGGDRAAGVQELEQMAAELERAGALENALTIIDELIRLSPESIRHHQKRVELSFRSSDRAKLIDAYIELGDALFRSGEGQKARAVYQRVLELAPDDARARAALDSVTSASPANGSGAIRAAASADMRTTHEPPRAARVNAGGAANGALHRAGAAHQSPARKPAPLDPRAAMNGDFVDLGEWLREDESPRSTRMVAEEKPPTGDEQADFQEMLKRFKQGVADNVDDEDYESHYDLGVAYKEMGLVDEAVAEFQKALRGSAHRVRAYEALGQCFVDKEQYQVAASVLSRAVALGEGDDHHLVGVLYLLGRATEALNRPGDALDYYQRVFAVDIEFRDVAERISAIERKAT